MTDEDLKKEKIRLICLFICICLFIGLCFLIVFWPANKVEASSLGSSGSYLHKTDPIYAFSDTFTLTNGPASIYEFYAPAGSKINFTDGNRHAFVLCSYSQFDDITLLYTFDYYSAFFWVPSDGFYTLDRDTYIYVNNPYVDIVFPEPSPSPSPSPSPTPIPPVEPVNFDITYIYIIIFLLGVTAVCMIFRK